MSAKLYDLAIENIDDVRDKAKICAWPVAAWKCFIPDSMIQDINILEKVVLTLVERGLAETKADIREVLCGQLGMNQELIKNVIDRCIEKYMDKRNSKLVLNADARKKLKTIEEGYSLRDNPSDSMKSIYLFQDLITNTIIPYFEAKKLPSNYTTIEDGEYINIGFEAIETYKATQPKTATIQNSIRQWVKIDRIIRSGDSSEISRVNVFHQNDQLIDTTDTYELLDEEILEDDIFEDDNIISAEVLANDDIIELGENNKECHNTLADIKSEESNEKNKRKNISNIIISDDNPQKMFLMGYFVFDPDSPEESEIRSPFGPHYNSWFSKIINRRLLVDENLRDELQLFRDEIFSNLKGKVAINNILDISLFKEFPLICNDHLKFGILKKSIEDLYKSYNKLIHGENEAKHFAGDLRTSLDLLFKCAVKENPCLIKVDDILDRGNSYSSPQNSYERQRSQSFRKGKFDRQLVLVGNKIGIDNQTLRKYSSKGIFMNLENDFKDKGDITKNANTKDLVAMILVYASENQNSKFWGFLENFNLYLDITYEMTKTGNDALHNGWAYINAQKAQEYYSKFEMIVRIVYNDLMED